ncbi:hypothetical protein HD554DRAFT_1415509 [Boletus coccyginus]|nr:hypothetical protein HD554DRAFT_1415509 [Boletus coccyginus]
MDATRAASRWYGRSSENWAPRKKKKTESRQSSRSSIGRRLQLTTWDLRRPYLQLQQLRLDDKSSRGTRDRVTPHATVFFTFVTLRSLDSLPGLSRSAARYFTDIMMGKRRSVGATRRRGLLAGPGKVAVGRGHEPPHHAQSLVWVVRIVVSVVPTSNRAAPLQGETRICRVRSQRAMKLGPHKRRQGSENTCAARRVTSARAATIGILWE